MFTHLEYNFWQPKEEDKVKKYNMVKKINLLLIAQAGPKDCGQFKGDWEDLNDYMQRNGRKTGWWVGPGDEKDRTFMLLIEFAERDPERIKWLTDNGFIREVEEFKPVTITLKTQDEVDIWTMAKNKILNLSQDIYDMGNKL